MIQRVQSILLLGVTIFSVCLLVFPFISYENLFNSFTLRAFKQPYCGFWYYTAEVLNALILSMSFICIFLFKKRMLQVRITNILVLLNVCLLAVLLFTQTAIVEDFLGGPKHTLWPSYLPIVSLAFAFMAGKFIKKDENLVRSADRIR